MILDSPSYFYRHFRTPYILSYSFIHSFIPSISIALLQVLYYSEAFPTTARILYRSFTLNAQATAGKGLAQGFYVAARAGVEPTTLRLRVIDFTNAPPRPTRNYFNVAGVLLFHCTTCNLLDKRYPQ